MLMLIRILILYLAFVSQGFAGVVVGNYYGSASCSETPTYSYTTEDSTEWSAGYSDGLYYVGLTSDTAFTGVCKICWHGYSANDPGTNGKTLYIEVWEDDSGDLGDLVGSGSIAADDDWSNEEVCVEMSSAFNIAIGDHITVSLHSSTPGTGYCQVERDASGSAATMDGVKRWDSSKAHQQTVAADDMYLKVFETE